MIGAATLKVGEELKSFRLSTRAMMAIEERFKKGLPEVVDELQSDPKITTYVRLLAEISDDGAGVPIEQAQELVDEVGFESVGALIIEATEKAFPKAKAKEAGKNAQGAGPAE